MSKLRGHKLKQEHKHSYEIVSPDGKAFHVAKAHLGMHDHALISKLPHYDDGGTVAGNVGDWLLGGGGPGAAGGNNEDTIGGKVYDSVTDAGPNIVKNVQGLVKEAPEYGAWMNKQGTAGREARIAEETKGAQAQTSGAPLQSAQNQLQSIYNSEGAMNHTQEQPYDYQQGNGPTRPDVAPTAATDMYQQYLQDQQAAVDTMQKANQSQADATATFQDKQAAIQDAANRQMQYQNAVYQQNVKNLDDEGEDLRRGIASTKIDPEQYWNSKSTAGKVNTLIGFIISGAGANANQGNAAIKAYDKELDANIDAQKANLGSQKTLLQYNLDKYKNLAAAEAQTRLDLMNVTKGQIEAEAARQGGPMAQAHAAALNAQLDASMAPIKLEMAKARTAMKLMSDPSQSNNGTNGQRTGVDMNQLQSRHLLGYTSNEEYNGGIKEAGEYQDQINQLKTIKDAFNGMKQNATYGARVANAIPGGSYAPTWDEQTKRYDATRAILTAAVSKILGARVNPTLMAEVDQALPIAGDTKETLDYKIAQLENIIKTNAEKRSFPILMKNGAISSNDPNLTIQESGVGSNFPPKR